MQVILTHSGKHKARTKPPYTNKCWQDGISLHLRIVKLPETANALEMDLEKLLVFTLILNKNVEPQEIIKCQHLGRVSKCYTCTVLVTFENQNIRDNRISGTRYTPSEVNYRKLTIRSMSMRIWCVICITDWKKSGHLLRVITSTRYGQGRHICQVEAGKMQSSLCERPKYIARIFGSNLSLAAKWSYLYVP